MITITENIPKKISGSTSLFLDCPYNQTSIDIIKSSGLAVWHKKDKVWEVPVTSLSTLLDNLTYIDDITLSLLPDKETTDEQKLTVNYKVKPFKHQEDAVLFGLQHKTWLLLDQPGLGKMEPISAKIPTPDGFRLMGNLNKGDRVFGSDGEVYTVLDIFEHRNKEIYKVIFSDGSSAECGLDHLWIVRDSNMRRRKQGWKVLSLKQMLSMGLQYSDKNNSRAKTNRKLQNKFEIPMTMPIRYPEKKYLIHPYILGMCLGDGNLCSRGISISIPDTERESVDRISSLLDDEMCLVEDRSSSCPRYRIKHKKRGYCNKYAQEIKRLKVNVKGEYKFIPDEYKYGSVEQRLDLLRGLMDSDGSIRPGTKMRYDTISEQLANDFCELVNSLGGVARKHLYDRRKEGKNIEYYVIFKLGVNPFYLSRKSSLYNPSPRYKCSRYIVSAEYIKNEDARCIMVDSPDSSYITGKQYIVTHNTASIIHLAEELKAQRGLEHCLIICGLATLRANWEKEIKFHSNETFITIGKKVNSKGNVSWATVKERAEQLKNKIDEFFVIINIESIREEAVVDAINNSVNNFDMIALDECHKCAGIDSIQSQNLLDLKNATYKIGMTGTLLTNSPLSALIPLKWIGVEHSTTTNYKAQYCEFGGFGGHQIVGYKNLELLKDEIDGCSLRRTKDLLDLPPKNIIDEYVEMDDTHRKFYWDVVKGVKEECDKIKLNTNNLLALTTRLRQATSCPNVLTSSDVVSSKIERCLDLVEDIVSQGDKVVVMSAFKEPIYQLQTLLKKYNPLVGTGDMKDDEVSKNIDKFQHNDKYKVMLCTQAKMGTGVTLNAAHYLIMLDSPWTFAVYEQCTDRIHRINNTEPVFIYNLICENTIDETVARIINRKKALSDYMVDDKEDIETMETLKKYILDL